MRRFSVCLVVACASLSSALLLGGCAGMGGTTVEEAMAQLGASKTTEVVGGLKREGTLTVGVRSSSAAPLLIEYGGGKLSGLSVELACALADEMGLKVAFVPVSDVVGSLGAACDVVMGVTSNEAEGFDVLGDYADSAIVLFHRGESAVVPAEQVQGATIGVQDGSAAQEMLHATAFAVTEVSFPSLAEAFDALENGTVDYVACHGASGASLAMRYQDLAFAGCLNVPVAEGFAMQGGEGELPAALRAAYDRLQANGILQETRRRWLGNFPVLSPQSQIPNIPMPETPAEGTEANLAAEDVSAPALDGSTAGANAAVLSSNG